jgi:hypothetical protein
MPKKTQVNSIGDTTGITIPENNFAGFPTNPMRYLQEQEFVHNATDTILRRVEW